MPQARPAVLQRVASLAKTFRGHYSPEIFEAIDRLVSYPEMVPVWAALGKGPDPALPEHFLDACALRLNQWLHISKLPTKKLIEVVEKLADESESLAKRLLQREAEVAFVAPFAMTLGYFYPGATSTQPLAKETVSHPTKNGDDANHETTVWGQGAEDDSEPILIAELLLKLTARLRERYDSELGQLRPTKANAETADRTFFVKSLTHFFLTHGGEPNAEFVARAATAAFDLHEPMTSDHVAHLTKKLRQISWHDADDYCPESRED